MLLNDLRQLSTCSELSHGVAIPKAEAKCQF